MAKYTKPENPNLIWAQDALEGSVVKPPEEKIKQGWIQQKPPLEYENWSIQRLFNTYAYYNQMGFPEWDAETEYQAGLSYVQGSDGRVYKSRVTGINQDPAGGGANYWTVAFLEDRFTTAYTKTLLDDATAEEARATLGLGSASTQDDTKYLIRDSNLSDILNKSTAFNNIKQVATTSRTGVVELATAQEVIEGVRGDVAVTPASLGGMNPAGTIITFAGPTAPGGYLESDGRLLSRTSYPNLFNAIGTTYGNTTSTNFRIPDLRGQFVRGFDNGRGLDANRIFGSNQSDQLRSHRHTGNTDTGGFHSHSGSTSTNGSHNHSGSTDTKGSHRHPLDSSGATTDVGPRDDEFRVAVPSTFDGFTGFDGAHSHGLNVNYSGNHNHSLSINGNGNHNHSFTTNYSGGNETRPTNVAMLFCIKT